MRWIIGTLGCIVFSSGCGLILDLGAEPSGQAENDGAVDSAASDTATADVASDTTDGDVATDTMEADVGPPPAANLLLYRATDGEALLVTVDASGVATWPRAFKHFGPGFGTVAVNGDLVLGYDQKKLEAHLFRVDWVSAAVTDLGTKPGAAPYEFSIGLPGDAFLVQITDYMGKNDSVVYRWNKSTSTLEHGPYGDTAAPWSTGIRIFDDHILLYQSRPAPESMTYWGVYDDALPGIVGTTYAGPTKQIGPFWEKLAPLGAAGVLAVRGVLPTARAWTDVPGNLAKDVTDLPAPIVLLQGTRAGTVMIHQGDSLVVGKLTPKSDALSFEVLHDNDTGLVAKSWTSMLVIDK